MARTRLSRRTAVGLGLTAAAALVLDALLGGLGRGRLGSIETVSLPEPRRDGDVSVEAAIENRRSRREYAARPLDRVELGQLLWATQGITARPGVLRAAPSAGALYPLELYVVVGDPGVGDLDAGVYHYRPVTHELDLLERGDRRADLQAASIDQEAVGRAPVDVVVCAVDERTTRKYGERGEWRYVPMEAGHAGENLYLQAEALGLSTVSIGAFDDGRVRSLVGAPADQRPLYVFPVGARA